MTGIKKLFREVRKFLFSNLNKQFMIFLFFVFLSSIFWLIMTLNDTYEKEIKIPVRVNNIPKNVVLTSSSNDTIRVVVRDLGWTILSYLLDTQHLGKVNINFRNYDKGNGRGIVSTSETKRLTEQRLNTSSKIISIKPERIEFFYNNGEYKRVPVRWAGRIIPDQLYFISQVVYQPDSIDVFASRQKLDSIQAIYTEPLNYVNFRDSLIVNCKLSHTNDVKVVPERINIAFYTDVLTEETIDGVPIQCVNIPAGKVLRTFPAKVKIHFVAGANRIRSLQPEDFSVVADYREIMQEHSDKCNIYLHVVPHGISRATLDIQKVDYLIEEE
jgi:hypothetical protein